MRSVRARAGWRSAVSLFLALLTTGGASAQLTVTPFVTPNAGMYHYDYTITNLTAFEVLLIDIRVAASVPAVQNLVAPVGFQAAFDPGLGLVTFLQDTDAFGPVPVSGFAFDSPLGPSASEFTGYYLDGNSLATITGPTAAPIPEAGTFAALAVLLGQGWVMWLIRARTVRRRTCV
jgi:hypothetical protein